jgi:hypothetical protein
MKEKKFKDIPNFGEKNTFYQFDQWETQRLWGAKNRFVYDFSFPVIPGKTLSQMIDEGANPGILQNLSPWGASTDLGFLAGSGLYGTVGKLAELVLSPGEIIKSATAFNNLSSSNFIDTVNEDEQTIEITTNTIGHIDAAEERIFTVQLDNWVDYFRSGYVEFVIKTTKQNCIVALAILF